MAIDIQSHTPGRIDKASLQTFVNLPGNLRMVNKETNRTQHRAIDQAIMGKSGTPNALTIIEENRARLQVKFIQGHSDQCPSGFYEAAKKMYKACCTQDGKTLWDARCDPDK